MGVTIQFESHRVELAAIYEMEGFVAKFWEGVTQASTSRLSAILG
jgi:hypothetical protein